MSGSSWDVVVAGAGPGGMVLATFAARRGARVLVVEASPQIGGALHVSTGQLSAAGTRLQAAKGIEDSPARHLADVVRISKGTVDAGLAGLAIEHAAGVVDWLIDECGLQVLPDHPVKGQNHEPYSTARYYWGADNGRSILAALIPPFEEQIAAGRVEVLLRTEVTALVQDGTGRVVGADVRDQDGNTTRHTSRQVVLATGGYNSDPVRFEQLNGVPQYADASYPWARGAGLDLGLSVGGTLRGQDKYLCSFGSVLDSEEAPAKVLCRPIHWPEMRAPWEVYVNVHGRRFVAEDNPSVDEREHALLTQPGLRRYIVFDARIARSAPQLVPDWSLDDLLDKFGKHPMFTTADTLPELAELSGIDPDGLVATIEQYNAARPGNDPLGRQFRPLPVAVAPYYAIRVQGMSITSTVGLAVDSQLRVLGRDEQPVDGLYAIGELLGTGQLMGNAFCGGMLATPAMTFGKLLGERGLQWT